jgi:Holliday junction resolvase RusA-like endonuclease
MTTDLEAARVVTFTVAGLPQPKGSTKAFVPKAWAQVAAAAGTAPRAIVTADNRERACKWQRDISLSAQQFAHGVFFTGPIRVAILFRLPRPVTLPRKVRHHVKKPDLDKLVRLVLDGLKGVLYTDDRAGVEVRARKIYAPPEAAPGADITVGLAAPMEPAWSSLDLFAEA